VRLWKQSGKGEGMADDHAERGGGAIWCAERAAGLLACNSK
jgi:hypothetical protein